MITTPAETKIKNAYEGKINWRIILHPRPRLHLPPKCRPAHAFLQQIHKPRLLMLFKVQGFSAVYTMIKHNNQLEGRIKDIFKGGGNH